MTYETHPAQDWSFRAHVSAAPLKQGQDRCACCRCCRFPRSRERGPAVVMAAGNERYIRHLGLSPVMELEWGQSVEIAGVTVTAVEVKHWGERYPWSRDHGYD